MMNLLWFFLPDSAFPLVIAGIGFALMFRLISGKGALTMIGGLALCLIAAPFVEALMSALPWWLVLIILFMTAMSLLRSAAGLLFGRAVANHVMGELIADVIRFFVKALFWLIALPFRILGRAIRNA